MDVLRNIVKKINSLEGFDQDKEYFEYAVEDRKNLISELWDVVFAEFYYRSLRGELPTTPLETHYDILGDLYFLLHFYEEQEVYEFCDILKELIEVTEDKIKIIDRYHADTK